MAKRTLSRRTLLSALPALGLLTLVGCSDDDAEDESPTATATATATATGTSRTPAATTTQRAVAGSEYFPPPAGDWERISAADAGFKQAGIDALVRLMQERRSVTFMMLSGGRILTENYFGQTTATSANDVASVQKSVTSTLIGIARERGLLTLEDRVSKYLPAGWTKAAPAHEGSITILHLMTHSSGLDPRTLQSAAAPGATFDYNSDAYQKLLPLRLKSTTGVFVIVDGV